MVSEKKMFDSGGQSRLADDRQMTEACLYYKLTHEPKGSGELKTKKKHLHIAQCISIFMDCCEPWTGIPVS